METTRMGAGGWVVIEVIMLLFLAPLGCPGPDPAVVDSGAEEAVSSPDLPPLEEQEIMDRRAQYCLNKFGRAMIDFRHACITGYLAQPISNSLNEFDE